jgi:hypothetical protein
MTTKFNKFCQDIQQESLKNWVAAGALSTAMMYPAYKKALNYDYGHKNNVEDVSVQDDVPKAVGLSPEEKKINPVDKIKSLAGNKILLKEYIKKLPPDTIRQLTGLNKNVPDNVLAPILFAGVYTNFIRFDVIAAVLSRESVFGRGLDKDGKGDHGHGHGIMQIDDRSHAKWLALGLWKDPFENIVYGIGEIKANLRIFKGDMFKSLAAYNTGATNVKRSLAKDKSAEATTAHGNYATDVLHRTEKYRGKQNMFVTN